MSSSFDLTLYDCSCNNQNVQHQYSHLLLIVSGKKEKVKKRELYVHKILDPLQKGRVRLNPQLKIHQVDKSHTMYQI